MISELSIMEKVKEVTIRELNDYLLADEIYGRYAETITEDNVDINFPEVEIMKKKNMIFITPQNGTVEDLTTCSDQSTMTLDISILVKRDPNESLCRRAFAYYTAFYKMIRNNGTLDGYVVNTSIDNWDFYPSVGPTDGSVVGIIATIEVVWDKYWMQDNAD